MTGPASTSGSDITKGLMTRLQRHYIKPSVPYAGGVFLPEIGWNGTAQSSRCDALYVGFTQTSGRMLIGHEVKASRSDWLTELGKPGKADAWADQCHEWWLVTVPGVVNDGELPAGWGLMYPGTSTTRMKIVTKAQRHWDRQPSWNALRSVIARMDTLCAQRISHEKSKAHEDLAGEVEKRVQAHLETRLRQQPDMAEYKTKLEAIEKALGGTIIEDDPLQRSRRNVYTLNALAEVAELLKIHKTLDNASRALTSGYSTYATRALREHLDALDAAVTAACASLPTIGSEVAL